ncbi:MAG: hypothetical protein MUF00_11805 [Gemmatimonadaceae bacterium]|jgi:hypothetical protein|nr:hypothetical protein [Gemmatimonadaceae bacterium]
MVLDITRATSRRRTRTMRWAALLLLLPLAWAEAQPPQRALPRAELEFPEPFTTISSLRELRDGRVIVTDAREITVQLIDLNAKRATPIGRRGAGPREWGRPGSLLPMPADTTLMVDFVNRRLLVIHPDGTPGRTEPEDERDPFWRGAITGVDDAGRVLLVMERRPERPLDGSVGVADVLRLDRRTQRVDTIGTLMRPKGERSAASMMGNGMMQLVTNLPLAARDEAVLTRDGRAVLVRAAPYRVEIVAPSGARTAGPVVSTSGVAVTRAEQEAFLRRQIRPGAILIRTDPSAPASAGRAARPRAPAISKAEFDAMMQPTMTWPRELPPFFEDAARAAPDGRVWVLRTRAVDDSVPVYDVFDRAGRVVERVALPTRTRVVGFGAGVAYLARTDDDDLVWLQRVRLAR